MLLYIIHTAQEHHQSSVKKREQVDDLCLLNENWSKVRQTDLLGQGKKGNPGLDSSQNMKCGDAGFLLKKRVFR